MASHLSRLNETRHRVAHLLRLGRLEGAIGVNIVSFGFNVLASIISARLLGPDGRGELAAMQSWGLLAVSFGTLGIPIAAAYYAGRDPRRTPVVYATAQVLLLLLAVPVYGITYILMPRLLAAQSESVIAGARTFLLIVFIQFGGYLPYYVLRGLGRLGIWNAIRVQFSLLWLAVFAVGYLTGKLSPLFAVKGYLAAMAFHSAVWMAVMFLSIRGPYRPELAISPSLLRYGLPSMLSSVPRELNTRANQLVMAAFLAPQTLGLYVVAVAWGGLPGLVTSSFAQLAFPRLAALQDPEQQRAYLQLTLRMSVLIGMVLGLGAIVMAPLLIPLVYGQDFVTAVPAALILVGAGFLSSLNNVIQESFRGMGMPKWPMVAEVVGLVSTVCLLPALLPRFGLIGAAIASLVSYTLVLLVFLSVLAWKVKVSPVSAMIPRRRDVRALVSHVAGILGLPRDKARV